MPPKKLTINWNLPSFDQYMKPYGFLDPHHACRMLFHYAVTARLNYETENESIVLEGEIDPVYNYKQLFKSLASAWGVEPEMAVKFWTEVDLQFNMLGIPKVPEHLRFKDVPQIVTETKN